MADISKIRFNQVDYDIVGTVAAVTPSEIPVYEGVEIAKTWDQIITDIKNGNLSGYHIGDWKKLEVAAITNGFATASNYKDVRISTNKQTFTMRIAGINTHKIDRNSKQENHIDWISKEIIPFTNFQWKNNGANDSTYEKNKVTDYRLPWGYVNNNLPAYDNSVVQLALKAFRNNAKVDNKLFFANNAKYKDGLLEIKASGIEKGTAAQLWPIDDDSKQEMVCWIPSEYEVFGSAVIGSREYSPGLAIQYPLFKHNIKNRIFYKPDGTTPVDSRVWTCTCADASEISQIKNINYPIVSIDKSGMIAYDAHTTARYVPLCFRLSS